MYPFCSAYTMTTSGSYLCEEHSGKTLQLTAHSMMKCIPINLSLLVTLSYVADVEFVTQLPDVKPELLTVLLSYSSDSTIFWSDHTYPCETTQCFETCHGQRCAVYHTFMMTVFLLCVVIMVTSGNGMV